MLVSRPIFALIVRSQGAKVYSATSSGETGWCLRYFLFVLSVMYTWTFSDHVLRFSILQMNFEALFFFASKLLIYFPMFLCDLTFILVVLFHSASFRSN